MERTITSAILKDKLFSKGQPAMELLYNQYSGMLFSYILQFLPDRAEAEALLVEVFSSLWPQLQRAFDAPSSIYCWLQVESRKIVLAHLQRKGDRQQPGSPVEEGHDKGYYFSLLAGASSEHRWVFRELFIYGADKEGVAIRSGKDLDHVSQLLRECLVLIRKNLG